MASTRVGYWRPEVAVYQSQLGTKAFRDSWRAFMDAGVSWVQQATWNDFGENHHVMPSENYSTTFCELNRFLVRQWKELPGDVDGPRVFLSQPQEVCAGEDARFEVLALLRDEDAPARAEFAIRNNRGEVVRAFQPVPFKQAGVQVAEFAMQILKDDPIPSRLLVPYASLHVVDADDPTRIGGSCTVVSAAGYHPDRSFSWLHTPAHRQLPEARCRLTLGGHQEGTVSQAGTPAAVRVDIDCPVPIADVEVLRNGVQLVSVWRDFPESGFATPYSRSLTLPLDRHGHLPWGYYAARAVTADGKICTSVPVFVERSADASVTVGHWTFDDDEPPSVLDSSSWLHDGRLGGRTRWEQHRPTYVPDDRGGKCLSFDGVDDRVLLEGPVVPPNLFTAECRVNWRGPVVDTPGGQLIFSTANAAFVLSVDKDGKPRVTRKSDGRWHAAQAREPLPTNEWRRLRVTYDGKRLRLYVEDVVAGTTDAPGESNCGRVAIGFNSVTGGSFFHGLIDDVRVLATVK